MTAPAAIVGIDLGTANSRVAVHGDSGPRILEDAQGARGIASAVSFRSDRRVLVGAAARRNALLAPRATVTGATRLVGRRWDSPEAQRVRETSSFDVVKAATGDAWIRVGTASMSPSQVQSTLLQTLAATAERELGVPVKRAVVTVPAGFDEAQRKATRDAGALAGLEVVRILNAPTAAALTYYLGRAGGETIAVVDVGAGSTEVAILRCEDGLVEVLGSAGDLLLGGDDFDRRIAALVRDEAYALHEVDVAADPVASQRVLDEVEAVKRALSLDEDATIALPNLMSGSVGSITIARALTRAELDSLTSDLVARVAEIGRAALAESRRGAGNVDAVIAIGGMTRAPGLEAAITGVFGKPPVRGVHRDEAVALGAAIASAVLDGRISDLAVVDLAAQTIGLRAAGDKMVPVIKRATAIPARVRKVFATGTDESKRVVMELYQGDDPVASKNKLLARLQLADTGPGPRSDHVELVVTLDAGGCLAVTARDPKTGRAWSVD